MVVYLVCPDVLVLNAILLTLIGVCVNGAAHIVSSVVSADLGQQDIIRGCREALATVTGIIDGTGTMGAAVGQVGHKICPSKFGDNL